MKVFLPSKSLLRNVSTLEGRKVELNINLLQTLVYSPSVLTWGFENFLSPPFSFYLSKLTFLQSVLKGCIVYCILDVTIGLFWKPVKYEIRKFRYISHLGQCYFLGLPKLLSKNNAFIAIERIVLSLESTSLSQMISRNNFECLLDNYCLCTIVD